MPFVSLLWPPAPDDLPRAERRSLHCDLVQALRPGSTSILDPKHYALRIWVRPHIFKLAKHWHMLAIGLMANTLLMLHAGFISGATVSLIVAWAGLFVGFRFKSIYLQLRKKVP
jgi:hypothetical protein